MSLRQERLQKEVSKAQALQKKGHLKEAINLYQKVHLKEPSNTLVINEIAKIYLQSNYINEGAFYLKKSLEIKPDQPLVLFDLGTAYSQLKNLEESLACYIKSIEYDDRNPKSYFNKGIIESELKYLNDALISFKKSFDLDPNNFNTITAIAVILTDLNFFDEAIIYLDKAIKINPNIAEVYFNKANLLKQKNKNEDALNNYDEAIKINPSLVKAYINKGILLHEMNLTSQALKNYDIAIQMNPNYCESYNNKAILLNEIGQVNEALDNLNKAIVLNPDYEEAYNNKGLVLHEIHRFEEALHDYKKAIELNPNYLEAYQNMAICYLNKCDFKEGWYFWEYREHLKLNFRQDFKKNFSELGNVFIFSEQGIGDVILYSSILSEIDLQSNKVTIEIDPRLINLFQRSFRNIEFLTKENKPANQNFDSELGIGSLPGYFRKDIQSFLKQRIPFLKPDQNKVNFYKKKLVLKNTKKLICGISWRSSNKKIGNDKSLFIEDLKKTLNYPEIIFLNLQYNITIEEVNFFTNHLGDNFQNFSDLDLFNDIDSLASLVEACDFIISTSNITAHIAGALNKKTFLLVPFGKGRLFYWHHNSSKSLWYPSIEIFNQPIQGDWESPLDLITKRIKEDYLL